MVTTSLYKSICYVNKVVCKIQLASIHHMYEN